MTAPTINIGARMHSWMRDLFPICRSITGDGVRQTLNYLNEIVPELNIHEVPTGTKVFDWEVPDEWNIRGAFIEDEEGNRILDFADNNLHVVGYSEPIDAWLSLDELEPHLHSLPEQPDAIPYVTSYYQRRWGFCLPHRVRENLQAGRYRAMIDSTLEPGHLTQADLLLRGREEKEILISTYVCHPSMANNELSGPVVAIALAEWLAGLQDRRYSYRFVFSPETIGAITYLSRNLQPMKEKTIAGFVATCIGVDRGYCFTASRHGNTLSDRVARHILGHISADFEEHHYLKRNSDERHYCSPGVDLPVIAVMRSRFVEQAEYHTSLDNLNLVTPDALQDSFILFQELIRAIEGNDCYVAKVPCEPQMGKRGLYPTLATNGVDDQTTLFMDILSYSDGDHDLLAIADMTGTPIAQCMKAAERLRNAGLIRKADIVSVVESLNQN